MRSYLRAFSPLLVFFLDDLYLQGKCDYILQIKDTERRHRLKNILGTWKLGLVCSCNEKCNLLFLRKKRGRGGQESPVQAQHLLLAKGVIVGEEMLWWLVLISPKAVSLLDPRMQRGEEHPFQHDNEKTNLTSKWGKAPWN